MKFNKLTVILLTIFITCSCGKQQNDLIGQEVCGKVKSIRTTGYEATEKFGEIIEGNVLYDYVGNNDINNLVFFNKEGCITEISYFNHIGNLIKKSLYDYNSDGKVTKINTYDGDGNETGRIVYTYNVDKKLTKIVNYDKSGKINYTQKNEWEGDYCIKSQFTNEYTKGNYSINEYEGNKLVKSVVFDRNGKETGEYTEYENGKMVKVVIPEFTIRLSYNDKGLCTSIVNGQLHTINSYRWSKGESYLYEYEYDTRGNWIRKVERDRQTDKAKRIFVREIEYY